MTGSERSRVEAARQRRELATLQAAVARGKARSGVTGSLVDELLADRREDADVQE